MSPLGPRDIGIGVMAHQSRAEEATRLMQLVPVNTFVMDTIGNGENVTGDATWRELAKLDTEWSIVLQDDSLPVEGFRHAAALALDNAPTDLVSFYVGTGRPYRGIVENAVQRARAADAHWLVDGGLHWGVSVAMKTEDIPGFIAWGAGHMDMPYDKRISTYFKKHRVTTSYTWPSLVDHADGETLVHRRKPRLARVAHVVGAREVYDGPILRIGAVAT